MREGNRHLRRTQTDMEREGRNERWIGKDKDGKRERERYRTRKVISGDVVRHS